ncbi:hypothetical protein [Streptomyces sp. NPDC048436]|uniref:hypothetical protein n=1 Tax=Streptomyces sp. NPDC048436 TaxID=3365550 RepID=UPI0037199D12
MEHYAAAHWVTEAAAVAAKEQGAGNLLRVVLIVMVVGCVLVAWFLLRGYRQGADAEETPGERGEETPGGGGEETPGEGGKSDGADDRADRNG